MMVIFLDEKDKEQSNHVLFGRVADEILFSITGECSQQKEEAEFFDP